jgi:hypothetical protein
MKVIMVANMSRDSLRRQHVAFVTFIRDVDAGTTERRRHSAAPDDMPDHPLMASNPSAPQEQQQQLQRQRLRFSDFKFHRTPGGRCTAEVELEWIEGIKVRGSASGQSSPTVDLRVAAEAALRAIERFSDNVLQFDLAGVKSIRAFDANVIIVSITNRAEGPPKLLGSCLVEEDQVRGAVIAVLGATNRVLGNFIAMR